MHKHVCDTVESDTKTSTKCEATNDTGVKEAVCAQAGGRHPVNDSKDIVGFKRAFTGFVV